VPCRSVNNALKNKKDQIGKLDDEIALDGDRLLDLDKKFEVKSTLSHLVTKQNMSNLNKTLATSL